MWIVRILSGPQAGKTFPLKEGKNKIGRGQSCDIQLSANGVSKEHLEISIIGDKVLFTDLNSSNGSFLNGVKVKGGLFKVGDKLSLHDVLIDLVYAQPRATSRPAAQAQHSNLVPVNPQAIPNQAPVPAPSYPPQQQNQQYYPQQYQQQYAQHPAGAHAPPPPVAPPSLSFQDKFERYIQTVVSPSLYKLVETFDFKVVLMTFVGVYVLLVTILAVIPLNQITSDSINIESGRRARTVARALAAANEKNLRNGDTANLSTDMVLKEEGIDDVYIVGKDGRLVAPPERLGQSPKDVGFYRKYKEMTREYYEPVGSKIGAAVPILSYDPDLQKNVSKAYAVVIYNPASMSFDEGKTISLFVQMLSIAAALGSILFFVLYKLVEYPYYKLTKSVDEAMRENKEQIQIDIQLPAMRSLVTNINNILTRLQNPASGSDSGASAGSKNVEYFNLLNLIGFPALMISQDGYIKKANASFEAVTNIQAAHIENQKVEMLPDQAMQKNIIELMQTATGNVNSTAVDRLEIAGHLFRLSCQAVTTSSGDVDCFFLTISPAEGAEGSAA